MTLRRALYLALALAGLVLPWWHNLAFAAEAGGFDLAAFVRDVFANHASSSIGWDIAVAATAFQVFVLHEARRLGMRHAWMYVVLTFAVAFAFAAPLFLFFRDRALEQQRAQNQPTA